MVKSAYTEETPIQGADFTSSAGRGADAWAQQLGSMSSAFANMGLQEAQARAAVEGMKEGLKGADAQEATSYTAAGRMFNSKMMTTALTTMSNQASQAALSIYQDATKNGYTSDSYKSFSQQFGAYGAKIEAGLHGSMQPLFKQVMMTIKGKYDTQISKHAMSQSLQNQKYMDLHNANQLSTSVLDLVTQGGNPKDINGGIDLFTSHVINSGIPSSTKSSLEQNFTEHVGVAVGMKELMTS